MNNITIITPCGLFEEWKNIYIRQLSNEFAIYVDDELAVEGGMRDIEDAKDILSIMLKDIDSASMMLTSSEAKCTIDTRDNISKCIDEKERRLYDMLD